MKAKKQANKQIHGLLFLFENGDFFSGLAFCPHVSGENGLPETHHFKNALQCGDV